MTLTFDKFYLVFSLLLLGFALKLFITSGDNFLFNIDNARDMVDVREMVELKKLRLIGPTAGIEGLYNGPGWYYLLAIPYIISLGNPYSEVILMITFWLIGGIFLILLTSKCNIFSAVLIVLLWISSNYVSLATVYAFNPNPVLLLTPVLIFFLDRYLKKGDLTSSILIWLLAGAFFNFEMAFGVFIPITIFSSIFLSGKIKLLKRKNFWIGFIFFALTLSPQIIFNFRHAFLLSNSVFNYTAHRSNNYTYSILDRARTIFNLYLGVIQATLMNWKLLTLGFLIGLLYLIASFIKEKIYKKENLFLISLLFVFTPFLFHVLIPINVMPWHLGGTMAAVILLLGLAVDLIWKRKNIVNKIVTALLSGILIAYSINNLELAKNLFQKEKSSDPSNFANEVAAVDYVYSHAQGKNFKVYIYLPSVIDYPYQYIFWWYGQRKFGYLPEDYAYLPNKPPYIHQKERFSNGVNPQYSGLTFLIKEPDNIQRRQLWENNFRNLKLLKKEKVGPLEVEQRI